MEENTIELINSNYDISIQQEEFEILTENTTFIDYKYVVNKPKINEIELTDNLSLKTLNIASLNDLDTKETTTNKTNIINSESSEIEYPNAKCVYEITKNLSSEISNTKTDLTNIENNLSNTQNNLSNTQNNLSNTQNALSNTQAILSSKADTNLNNLTQKGLEKFNSKMDINFSNITASAKTTAISWTMASSSFINLSLGASGTSYTAPANGYYLLCKYAMAQAENIGMRKFEQFWAFEWAPIAKINLFCWVPVQKGESISVSYSASGETRYFRFYYAEGEV